MTKALNLVALTSLGTLLGFLTVILLPFLFVYYYAYWRRHERQVLLDAANCADYLNTEHGTRYTAEEVDEAYRMARLGAWIDDIESEITKEAR